MSEPQEQLKRDLTQGSILKHIFVQGVPMMLALTILLGTQVANTVFVSKLGAIPLAVLALSLPVYMVAYNIVFGVSIATASLVSRAIGAGEQARAASLITAGLVVISLAGIVFFMLGQATIGILFPLLGATPDLQPIVAEFMRLWYVIALVLGLPIVANGAFRAMGNAGMAARTMVTLAAINLFLDVVLIFGLFGFPKLGLQGVAVAMIVAYATAGALALYVLNKGKFIVACRNKAQLRSLSADVKTVFQLAMPTTLTNLLAPLAGFFVMAMVGHYGSDVVAGFGAGLRVEAALLAVMMATVSSMAPIVGQNFGAQNMDRTRATIKLVTYLLTGIYGVLGLGLFVAGHLGWLGHILGPTAGVQEMVGLFFIVNAFGYVALAFNGVVTSALNAIGRAKLSLYLSIIKFVVLQVPLAWAGGALYGVGGILAGLVIGQWLAAVASYLVLRRVFWQNTGISDPVAQQDRALVS